MTAICPAGGTSSPRPGLEAAVIYSSGLIAVLLDKSGYKWAIPVIPLLGLPPFTLSTFCATDPPAQPTFTLAETNAILQLDFGAAFQSGVQKLRDLVLNRAWYELCHCDSGTATGPDAPQVPTGTPVTLPPVTIVEPCATQEFADPSFFGGTSGLVFTSVGYLGRQATSIRVRAKSTVSSGAGCTVRIDTLHYNDAAGHVLLRTDTFNLLPGQTAAPLYSIPAGADRVFTTGQTVSGAGIVNVTGGTDVFCNGAVPGDERGPCECGPDPVVLGLLEQILGMVTLVQRQAVPFGVIAAAEHVGLSGQGEIAVQGLIGLQVTLTTVPGSLGHLVGHPDVVFDAGYITWGDDLGWRETERITHTPYQTFPRAAGAATRVGYSLEVGVVATIREIDREA